jgi:hypothetical protein
MSKGRQRKKIESDVYLAEGRWPLNGVGRYFFSFFLGLWFMAFLCVSQQGEFKNTIKKVFGESPCQKLLAFGRKS